MENAQRAQVLPLPLQPPAKKRSYAKIVLPSLVVVAAAIAGIAFALGRGRESTDDAQVEGRIMNVAPRVSGQVQAVRVLDNQLVEAGQPLVEIDASDYDVRLEASRADLAQARAGRDSAAAQLALTERNAAAALAQANGGVHQARAGSTSSTAQVAQARADIQAARSRVQLAQLDLDRVAKLHADGAVAQAELDARQAAYDQAVAALDTARARLASAAANSDGSSGAIESANGRLLAAQTAPQQIEAARAALAVAEARVRQAEAATRLAELNRSYTTIVAPVRGRVSRRNVEVGQMIGPERPLMAIVPPDDIWVVANFKEDQVAEMRPGQTARVRIDGYGRRDFVAHVDSLAGASGARFSLLPPDNASGNFVKVVQRIPVLVRFDGNPGVEMRPGMSATVTVVTQN